MTKRIILTLAVSLCVFGGIFGYKYLAIRKGMAAQRAVVRPPVTVSTAPVKEETWPNTIEAVGALASFRGITVKSEIEGAVRHIAFTSGATVAAGAPLLDLDDSIETASLPGLEAQAKLAAANLARARELRTAGTNTPADLDVAEAAAAQTQSAVAQLRATLAKKHVVAPFAGRLGLALVYPGQFLAKAEAIVRLEALDPIYVDFSLPQQELARVSVGQRIEVSLDAYPGQTFAGEITAIAPRVNDSTRSIDLRATLENKAEKLRPGMFARVAVILPPTERALVLPSTAVVHNPYGESVYVVENNVAQQRFIKTGPQRGNLILIREGLQPGQQVVTSGQIKLRNGSPVRIDNALAPNANPAPKPDES